MKHLLVGATAVLLLSGPVRAENSSGRMQNAQNIRKEIRQEIKNTREELKTATAENRQNVVEKMKDLIKSRLPKRINGTLTTIDSANSVLTVTGKDGTVYTVNVTAETKLKRKFGANSTLSEFMPGDELAIVANRHKVSDTEVSETVLDAKYIRNLSIQRRNTVFLGTIGTKSEGSFTVATVARGTQTVMVDAATTYSEKDKPITYADLAVGDKVVVKGELWDRANTKINAKKVMRLVRSSPTPTTAPTQ